MPTIRCARFSRKAGVLGQISTPPGREARPRSRAAAQAARPARGGRGIPPRGETGTVFVPKARLYVLDARSQGSRGSVGDRPRRSYHRELAARLRGCDRRGKRSKHGATSSWRWTSSDAADQRGDAVSGLVHRAARVEHFRARRRAAGLVKYRVVARCAITRTTSTIRWMTRRTVAALGWC